jgi:hypothetical protein
VTRRRSLRTNLFVAIVLVVVLSIGLMLVVGAVLTRRQVEHATLEGLAPPGRRAERSRGVLDPASQPSTAAEQVRAREAAGAGHRRQQPAQAVAVFAG